MNKPPVVSPETRELASRLYVDLAVRATEVNGGSLKMNATPDNLARASFKLAFAFNAIERELNEASLPKNQDFKVDVESIANWSKP